MMVRTITSLGLFLTAAHADAGTARPVDAPAAAFAAMKAFVGSWRIADKPDSSLRIRFSLTAAGTVLVEEWRRMGRPWSLTLYHRDGASLIATHYCPQGNQPRLTLAPQSPDGGIAFAFRDATDLDAGEEHLVALSFRLTAAGMIDRREIYRQGGVDTPSELLLVREPTTTTEDR